MTPLRISASIVTLALVVLFGVAGYLYLRPLPAVVVDRPTPAAQTAVAEPTVVPSTPSTVPETVPTELVGSDAKLASLESLKDAVLPRRDPVRLAVEFGRTDQTERVVRSTPLDVQVGSQEIFWISDIPNSRYYTSTATLEIALDHVLMYVENGVRFDREDLERSARQFNDEIYPTNRRIFGSEWSPGVDGDPRLVVLNGRIAGVGGYFSGSDEMPRSVNRFSNQREMFYINLDDRTPGSASYASVLAHEFQHMIQWHEAQRPTTWLNEGLAQIAEDLNGFQGGGAAFAYLAQPDLQLTAWAASPNESIGHYGASYLFLSYFYQQYNDVLDLQQLIREEAGERLDLFAVQAAKRRPEIKSFADLYGDWAVANLINDRKFADGRYSYTTLPDRINVFKEPERGALEDTVEQWGSDYIDLPAQRTAQVLEWQGSQTIKLFDAEPNGAVWWSNRGDSAASTLTYTFDLSQTKAATLRFRLWYDIEQDYDYGFVSASVDGKSWTTLRGNHTTDSDPQGANYGQGYTGTSGGSTAEWVDEQIDLSSYAGQTVYVRFSLISDDAYNTPGMVIDSIRVPELNFTDSVDGTVSNWTTDGWQQTNNRLPQQWILRLVRTKDTTPVSVETLTPDATGRVRAELAADEHAYLVVAASTPHTTEKANYTLTLQSKP